MSAPALRISARASGRSAQGFYFKDSPHHGCVDIRITHGPSANTGVRLQWQQALEFSRALRTPAFAETWTTAPINLLRVVHDGSSIRVERFTPRGLQHWFAVNANPEADESARRSALLAAIKPVADAISQAAHQAEQDMPKVAEQVAEDQAILVQGGMPFGLTTDARILDAARKEVQSNSTLRRRAPGPAVQRASIYAPVPGLVMGPADPAAAFRARFDVASPDEQRAMLAALRQRISTSTPIGG